MKRNLSLGGAMDRARRQRFDRFYGGQRSQRSLADTITQSLGNTLAAPRNNRPGREFPRRDWGNNLAGIVQQDVMNTIVDRPRGRKPRR